jgi:hypothetical protein
MDETNNTPLNVKLQLQNSGVKQDTSGAFILSDAPQGITVVQPIGGVTVVDTTGYQSIQLTTGTYAGTILGSNDGNNFFAIFGYNAASLATISSLTAGGNFLIPAVTRYVKFTSSTAGQFTYYLRYAPPPAGQNLQAIAGTTVSSASAQLGMNIVNYGGTAVVNGGLGGTTAIGGTNAVGTASVSNPVIAGGVDQQGLARRATSTPLGDLVTGNRVIPTSSASISSATTGNAPIGATGYNNQIPITVQDTTQFEGQSQVELLAQLLQEVKILNQQMYELPRVIALALQGPTAPSQGQSIQLGDDPYQLRQDSSLFINQQ